MLTQKVFKAIREKMSYAPLVRIQQDNASCHVCPATTKVLKSSGLHPRHGGTKIVMVDQSANSPETNANDLGFFPSMSARISKTKPHTIEDLCKEVHRSYHDYEPETLGNIFDMKTRVLGEIIKAKGNNHH